VGFDAGSIDARLTVDTAQFDRDMDAAEARVKRFTDNKHEIKVSAVFDSASLSKATKAFSDLDNQISRQAAQRLRSSPQGSVLGALNALFSPHPVTGAPSASQSAQGGLLGKIVQAPATNTGGGSGGTNRVSTVGQVLGTNGGTANSVNRVNVLSTPARSTTTTTTTTTSAGGNSSSSSSSSGGGSSKSGGGSSNNNNSNGATALAKNVAGGIGPGILGIGLKPALITGAVSAGLAALPALGGIAGVGIGVALIGGLVAAVAKSSPKIKAQFSAIGTDAKAVLAAASGPIIPALSAVLSQVPKLLKSLEPQLAGIFKVVAPQLQSVFNGLVPIIRGLISLMQAAAPAFGPFIVAIEKLVSSLLPGLAIVAKATVPVIGEFVKILASFGGDLGALFADLAPAVRASMSVLGALLGLVGGLLPVVAKLADIFAKDLAPIIAQFAGVVKALTPPLTIIGSIIANLAGAILGDLVSAFGALAQLLIGIAPGLSAFAGAISQVFTVLENTGTFAILGDALENLAGPLAKLINLILTGLAPLLPPVIQFIGQLSGLLATTLSNAIETLLPSITKLVVGVLQVLTTVLPVILPLLLEFANIFTASIAQVIQSVATALADIINAIPPSVLGAIVAGVLAIVGAMKLWAAIQTILDAELLANPIGLIIAAIALLVVGISELVTHWSAVWGTVKSVGDDVYKWMLNDFIDPMINWFTKSLPNAWDDTVNFLKTKLVIPVQSTLTGVLNWIDAHFVTPVVDFFTKTIPSGFDSAISFMRTKFIAPFQSGLQGAYNWVVKNVADPIQNLFTKTMPGWFNTAVSAISGVWGKVEGAVEGPVKFVVNNVLDKLIGLFDSVINAVGLGSLKIPLITLASGGKLPGYGGGDSVPALLEPGEAVIDKDKTREYGWLFKMMGVPGFATGGAVGSPAPGRGAVLGAQNPTGGNVLGGVADLGKAVLAIATGNPTALSNAVLDLLGGSSSGGMGGIVGRALLGMPATLVGDFAKWIIGQPNKATGQGTGSATLKPSGSGATVQALMQSMAASVGWTGAEWIALDEVENREAGFNINATNPTSGAYGLAQFINGPSEYAQYGGNSTTAAGQITGMLNYIKQRYGDPEAAWAHELGYGWYDKGGYLQPGYTLAYNGTGRPEPVISGSGGDFSDKLDQLHADLQQLTAVTGSVPAGVGRHVGSAINGSAAAASFRNRYPRGGS
jgi:phage-related protein